MNFMTTLTPGVTSNQDLQGPELKEAINFVDELISLKVLTKAHPSTQIRNSFPLFLVPKPGQPGQFNVTEEHNASWWHIIMTLMLSW